MLLNRRETTRADDHGSARAVAVLGKTRDINNIYYVMYVIMLFMSLVKPLKFIGTTIVSTASCVK